MVASTRTIQLDDETEVVFEELARRRGISVEQLLVRLARQAAVYEDELLRGIDEGIADADAKRFVSADEVKASVRAALKR
jgi:predicted transcriptional regulator